jgi:hypothetical protein
VGKIVAFRSRPEVPRNIGPKRGKSALPNAAKMFNQLLNKYAIVQDDIDRRDLVDDFLALRNTIRHDLELLSTPVKVPAAKLKKERPIETIGDVK